MGGSEMRRLRCKAVDISDQLRIPDLDIIRRYSVDPHAYGYCTECNEPFDYWKYGDTDYVCPYGCGTPLKEPTPAELAAALEGCEEDGCFEEEFTYPTPLKPVRKPGTTK